MRLGLSGALGRANHRWPAFWRGTWPPAAGEIRLGGARLDQYDQDVLGTYIGYLPQDVILFDGTVAENIARMSEQPDEAEVVRAAQAANVHDLILSLPNGYGTIIEGGDVQLSGGQRQRIALARAIYGNPEYLILDEPNSALDAEGSHALNLTVRDMKARGKAVIIMTHRPAAISECERLVVLDGGKVQAQGPRDEVLQVMTKNADALQRGKPKGSMSHAN